MFPSKWRLQRIITRIGREGIFGPPYVGVNSLTFVFKTINGNNMMSNESYQTLIWAQFHEFWMFRIIVRERKLLLKIKDEGHVLLTFASTLLPLKILMLLSAALKKKSKWQRQRRSWIMNGRILEIFETIYKYRMHTFFNVGLTDPR